MLVGWRFSLRDVAFGVIVILIVVLDFRGVSEICLFWLVVGLYCVLLTLCLHFEVCVLSLCLGLEFVRVFLAAGCACLLWVNLGLRWCLV